jgi:hypothetical protein
MLEIYSSSYYLIKHRFNYKEMLENFCAFGDRVTIAVNTCDDGTWGALNQWKTDNKAEHLNLVSCNLDRNHPWFDGMVKNFALKNTIYPYKIGLDADERVCIRQKDRWLEYAKTLEKTQYKSALIPSLDLWGDCYTLPFDSEKNINLKWYLHLPGLERRPIREALLPDGRINNTLSDGCEVCLPDGRLAAYTSPVDPLLWNKVKRQGQIDFQTFTEYINHLKTLELYVFHTGFVNFKDRVHRNVEWWDSQWEIEGGKKKDIALHESQLFKANCYKHGLKLWWE